MSFICFASAALQTYGLLFPYDGPVEESFRITTIGLTLLAGIGYWVFAKWFRMWMLYLIVLVGLTWGCLGLYSADSPIRVAVVASTLLWTCVYIGAFFTPPVARIYAGLLFAGMFTAFSSGGFPSPFGISIVLASSFYVTMEILSRATTRLRKLATLDPLTGLLNRSGLETEAGRLIALCRRQSRPVAVLHADLDDFKAVNDSQGHTAGDEVLIDLANSLGAATRAADLLARVGGDEFVAVLPDVGASEAGYFKDRLKQASPVEWSGGIVVLEDGEGLDSALARADLKLYEEKAGKKAGTS